MRRDFSGGDLEKLWSQKAFNGLINDAPIFPPSALLLAGKQLAASSAV